MEEERNTRALVEILVSLSVRVGRRSQAILVNLRNQAAALCHNAEALSGAIGFVALGHAGIPPPCTPPPPAWTSFGRRQRRAEQEIDLVQVVGQSHSSRFSSTAHRTTRTNLRATARRHARTTLWLGVRVRRCLPGTSAQERHHRR